MRRVIPPSNCLVCSRAAFETVFSKEKLEIFSALKSSLFTEQSRFDATLFRCQHCGFVQQNPSRSLKRFLKSFYAKAESFATAPPARGALNNKTDFNIEFLRRHLRFRPRRILEIGCYDGYFLDSLRKNLKAKVAVGIEILKLKTPFPRLRIVHDSYPTRHLNGERFDLIVMMSVLEHIFTPRSFMAAIKQNLNPGGTVLISVPHEGLAFKYGMLSFHHQHISYFTPVTIKRFLASNGFKVDVIYLGDPSRIMLLCTLGDDRKASSLRDRSAVGYQRRWQKIMRQIRTSYGSGHRTGFYGACNFTHTILQMVSGRSSATVFDGDPRKHGMYMSGIGGPVQSWEAIDSSKLEQVLIMPLAFTPTIATFLRSRAIKTFVRKLFPISRRGG